MSDGACNVKKAGEDLCAGYEDFVERAKILHGNGCSNITEAEIEGDDEAEEEEDEFSWCEEGDNDALAAKYESNNESRGNNNFTCVDHKLNLTAMDLVVSEDVVPLVQMCDTIVSTFKRSAKLLALLKKTLKCLRFKALRLVSRVITRWNSCFRMLQRIIHVREALVVMCHEGTLKVHVPDKSEAASIGIVLKYLAYLSDATTIIEAQTLTFTTPHLIHAVNHLRKEFSDPTPAQLQHMTPFERRVRATGLTAIRRRLEFVFEDKQCIAATCMYPSYWKMLIDTCSESKIKEAVAWMVEWLELYFSGDDEEPTDDEDVPACLRVAPAPRIASAERARVVVGGAVSCVYNAGKSSNAQPPTIFWGSKTHETTNQFAASDDQMRKTLLDHVAASKRDDALVLARIVLAKIATSASAEEVFSGASLENTPRRNRMSPETFEKCVVTGRFARGRDPTKLKEELGEVIRQNCFK
jgi:hypothetical protein